MVLIVTGGGIFAFALLVRLAIIRFESLHLHYAWDFLHDFESGEDRAEARTTLLERTAMALRASRLWRLFTSFLLASSFYLVGVTAFQELLPGMDGTGRDLILLIGGGLLLGILFNAINGLNMRGLYDEERPRFGDRAPRWLRDQETPAPALAAASAFFWDWFLRGAEGLLRPLKLEAPEAFLLEKDDELIMAVGEEEMAALGARTSSDKQHGPSSEGFERAMIRSIQRLDETYVREVMRPLNNVTAVWLSNFSPERFLALARRTGYTRFPCYYDQVTNLVGYLNVYDFLDSPDPPRDVRAMIHDAPFIPELAHLDVAFAEMLRLRSQIALCFDEYGGCSGLLSREDIIEEITGEIMDEYDRPEETKLQRRYNHYIVDALVDLDDLAEQIGLEIESDVCDTLAGYIYERLSRVPRRGESLDERGWRIEIVRMDRHRIRKVRLIPPEGEPLRDL